jgi:hypothetical protein
LCLLAGAIFLVGFNGTGPNPAAYLVFSVPSAAFSVWAMISMIRGLKTLVREFNYDGRQLRFRAIAHAGEQVRDLADVVEIRQGRSPKGSIGYVLAFRDGRKVYLDYSLQKGGYACGVVAFRRRSVAG